MNTYEPEFIGITNFSRIFVVDTEKTCWYKPEQYAQPDVEIDITERRDKIGGGPRIRTANVYHGGPDLQSGAAHAIAARPPKLSYRSTLLLTLL